MAERREVLQTPRAKELKRKRKVSRRRKAVMFFFLFIAIIVGFSYLSKINQMKIDSVVIRGNTVVSTDEILKSAQEKLLGNYFYLFSKQNFLIYPKGAIESNITEKIKRIENTKITLQDHHNLIIEVKEREGKYLWCGYTFDEEIGDTPDQQCYFLNDTGYIFAKAPYFSGNVYFKFYGGGFFPQGADPVGEQYISTSEVSDMRRLVASLEDIGINPYALMFDSNGDKRVYISSIEPNQQVYTKILFNKKDEIETVIKNLTTALDTEPLKSNFEKKFSSLLYIDLRFENKVYYKFKEIVANTADF